jgi:hypothetical protein
MKPLAIWLVVVAVVFGGFALITSALRDTTHVFVVVDSSFQMRPVWSDVQLELDRIDDEEHAEFALATEKGPVHSWQSELTLVGVEAFAPCTFGAIGMSPEAAEADERILVTTSVNTCDLAGLANWEVIELEP